MAFQEKNLSSGGDGSGDKKVRFRGVVMGPGGKYITTFRDRLAKKRRYIGSFGTAEEAARAYDKEAIALRGPKTRTNFNDVQKCTKWDSSDTSYQNLLKAPIGKFPLLSEQGRSSPLVSQEGYDKWKILFSPAMIPFSRHEFSGYKYEEVKEAVKKMKVKMNDEKMKENKKKPLPFDLNLLPVDV